MSRYNEDIGMRMIINTNALFKRESDTQQLINTIKTYALDTIEHNGYDEDRTVEEMYRNNQRISEAG